MNRKLIIRMLGALVLIESVAMIPSLFVAFIFNDGDAASIGLSIGMIVPVGILMFILPKTEADSLDKIVFLIFDLSIM